MDSVQRVSPINFSWRLLLLVALTAVLCLATLAAPRQTYADSPDTEAPAAALSPSEQLEAAMFERINEIRISYGLQPFVRSALLDQAAGDHVEEAAARRWISHWGVNGSGYYTRVAATGYEASKVNECIGWGNNLDRMINWWMNSYVHRNMLLSSTYTEVGIGYAGTAGSAWQNWWVVNVARPAN